mmetsp:Transcript_27060/g.49242  ORF Transcript_27060/g.49242 Transcript_27060/m.49242 type:complete len:126 (-) Transcript_27060:2536-2913(-)
MMAMRSPMRTASSRSWVMNTVVFFKILERRINSSCNWRRINGSRAENGSSISSTSGFAASARASPTRCCMPPDSSWANLAPQAPSSTISRIAAACRIRSFLATCRISSGIATLSSTDRCGIKAKF